MRSHELRKKYLEFFKSHGHQVLGSASVIPENDPTVLFNTAGMQPLVPYLLGKSHPSGTRLTNVQKCIRTGDIESVGDDTHCTFFEMLGNWSLGDYFKNESIEFSFEFLTKVLGIDIKKLWVTVFEGDKDAPRDEVSAKKWLELGIPKERISYLPKKHNWWIAGETGPCGPDTEIFIDMGTPTCGKNCDPSCDCGKFVEIWNNVFMEFNKLPSGEYKPLSQKNVDTGMGLERTICILSGKKSVYDTDLYQDAIAHLSALAVGHDTARAVRIVADHTRTAVMMIGDERGIVPAATDQGYVLRRLIRRAIRFAKSVQIEPSEILNVAKIFIKIYGEVYSSISSNQAKILSELGLEIDKFSKTLENGLKELEKVLKFIKDGVLPGKTAFRLYDTFGFPFEITEELSAERGFSVDKAGFLEAEKKHKEKSSAGAEQKFKGGLADSGVATTNLHTATHIMLRAMKNLLGEEVNQRGSNITPERLRFDFNFARPLTADEIAKIEAEVNRVISSKLPVLVHEMTVEDARKKGAVGIFDDKYSGLVSVYEIKGYHIEICGGPHATNTGELGEFKITKEQSSSAGVRRIKAVLK